MGYQDIADGEGVNAAAVRYSIKPMVARVRELCPGAPNRVFAGGFMVQNRPILNYHDNPYYHEFMQS